MEFTTQLFKQTLELAKQVQQAGTLRASHDFQPPLIMPAYLLHPPHF